MGLLSRFYKEKPITTYVQTGNILNIQNYCITVC